jgi:hypothetical protein
VAWCKFFIKRIYSKLKFLFQDSGEPLQPLTYVKVVGQVKTFAGKAHVVAHHVSKMYSLNELIAHSIECIHASMSIRKQGELVSLNASFSIIKLFFFLN